MVNPVAVVILFMNFNDSSLPYGISSLLINLSILVGLGARNIASYILLCVVMELNISLSSDTAPGLPYAAYSLPSVSDITLTGLSGHGNLLLLLRLTPIGNP